MSNDKKNAPGDPGVDEKAAFSDADDRPREEVENLSAKPEQEEEEEATLPEDPVERLKFVAKLMAAQYPDAPTANHLATWKQQHGEVFVTPIDERSFVYRYLKRQEWAQMLADEGFQSMNNFQEEEYIFEKCVLWPKHSPQQKAIQPAGDVSTIAKTIRLSSGFLNPEALLQFTIKL